MTMDPPSHTGPFAFIRDKYDRDTLLASRRFVNTSKRMARQRQHLAFNSRCKRYSLIPIYLRVRPQFPRMKEENSLSVSVNNSQYG